MTTRCDWSTKDKRDLIALEALDLSRPEIAERLGRTCMAVQTQIYHLRKDGLIPPTNSKTRAQRVKEARAREANTTSPAEKRFIRDLLRLGGFPRSVDLPGKTVWINYAFEQWTYKPEVQT